MKNSNQTPGFFKRVQNQLAEQHKIKNTVALLRSRMTRHKFWTFIVSLVIIAVVATGVVLFLVSQREEPAALPLGQAAAAYEKQLPDLKKAVEDNGDDAIARKNYAIALYAVRNLDEAQKQYEEAAKLNDQDSVVFNNLGNVYRDKNNINKAVEAYQTSLLLNPKSVNSYANLANIQLYTQDKPQNAIETYKNGLKQLPENVQLELLLGIAYEQANDKANAKKAYETILARDASNVAALAGIERIK